ncbi:MAG: magnesium-translocating P-type ATPase [Candidatus Micrarchaeota archaeon]|nr:magnesium-translocating P-type ATPase [Candidatus Micrarchaeota archaeon]
MNNHQGKYWSMDTGEVAAILKSDLENGLGTHEAALRKKQYGKNVIPEKDRRTWLEIFLSQFNNAFIFILLIASIITLFVGDTTEALTIIAILILSALLGFYQEYRSENALHQLKKYLSHKAVVIRDGKQEEINAEDLVPGDIVLLEIGNVVPADVRLIKCDEFHTNESSITGESRDVVKDPAPLKIARPAPHELSNYALMGTTVSYGTAKGIVVATGTSTYFGKTAALYSAKMPESDFQANIRKFSAFTLRVIVMMTIFVFIVNSFLGRGILESLLFALAVAVGIAPEMLPAITTITLSNGALKMAEKKAVVKKLASIEDIGLMDVLLMDKTGTLTEPEMMLEKAITPSGKEDGLVLKYGLLCSHAHTHGRHVSGNVYDAAILKYATARHITKPPEYVNIDDIGFDYERKRMSEVFRLSAKSTSEVLLITKGEGESVLSVCDYVNVDGDRKSIGSMRRKLHEMLNKFSKEGYSVIAVASRAVKLKKKYSAKDECGLTLEGFLLFKSQPKKTAIESIRQFKELGISLMLLTGDDPHVTERLCKDVKLEIKGKRVITGKEIDRVDDVKLRKLVEKHNIFARVTPAQKVRILEAVRANGHIVGFMGDGVNDAPALRLADVGISVNTAQDVAKEAADVVLTHKSLRVIADGVREGRKTFGNITKYILNTISANYGNMATVIISPLFLPFIPLLPVQILLNNLLSDFPLLAISTDNVDERFIKKPRRWNVNMISRFMVFFGIVSSIFDLLTIFLFYFVFGVGAALLRTLWFLESLLSEVFITFIIRTRGPFFASFPSKLLITSSLFITIAAVAFVSLPTIGQYFDFEPPTPEQIAIVFGIVFLYCVTTEVVKHWFFSHFKEFDNSY